MLPAVLGASSSSLAKDWALIHRCCFVFWWALVVTLEACVGSGRSCTQVSGLSPWLYSKLLMVPGRKRRGTAF